MPGLPAAKVTHSGTIPGLGHSTGTKLQASSLQHLSLSSDLNLRHLVSKHSHLTVTIFQATKSQRKISNRYKQLVKLLLQCLDSLWKPKVSELPTLWKVSAMIAGLEIRMWNEISSLFCSVPVGFFYWVLLACSLILLTKSVRVLLEG